MEVQYSIIFSIILQSTVALQLLLFLFCNFSHNFLQDTVKYRGHCNINLPIQQTTFAVPRRWPIEYTDAFNQPYTCMMT